MGKGFAPTQNPAGDSPELGAQLKHVEDLIGFEKEVGNGTKPYVPMAKELPWIRNKNHPLHGWVFNQNMRREDVLNTKMRIEKEMQNAKNMGKFENIVLHNVAQHWINREQLMADKGIFGIKALSSPLDKIAISITAWQYMEAQLQDYVSTIRSYYNHIENHYDVAGSIRQKKETQDLEKTVTDSLRVIEQILPALQLVQRIIIIEDLVSRGKAEDPKEAKETIEYLRSMLPMQGQELSGALKGISLHTGSTENELALASMELDRRLLTQLGAKASFSPLGQNGRASRVQVSHALYASLLAEHNDILWKDMIKDDVIDEQEFEKFLNVSRDLLAEKIRYHKHTLKHSGDMIALLATKNMMGPKPTGFEAVASDPRTGEPSKTLLEIYQRFIISDKIEIGLDADLGAFQNGLLAYMGIVADELKHFDVRGREFEEKTMSSDMWKKENKDIEDTILWTNRAYVIPEWTIGIARNLSFGYADYRKLLGNVEQFKNKDLANQYLEMERDAMSITMIYEHHLPNIGIARDGCKQALDVLNGLIDDEHTSPKNYKNLPLQEKEAVRQEYVDAITSLRDHQREFASHVSQLYVDLDKNLEQHGQLMAAHKAMQKKNYPSFWVGAGVTSAELAVAWKLGGRGGPRSVPYWGRTLKPFINNPTTWFHSRWYVRFGKFLVNAPGRTVNAPLRPVMFAYNLWRVSRGKEWIKRVYHDLPVYKQLNELRKQLKGEIRALERTASTAVQENTVLAGKYKHAIGKLTEIEEKLAAVKGAFAQSTDNYKAVQSALYSAHDQLKNTTTQLESTNKLVASLQTDLLKAQTDGFQQEMRYMLDNIDRLKSGGKVDPALWREFVQGSVDDFMSRFNQFAEFKDEARRLLGDMVYERYLRRTMTDAEWDALKAMHKIEGVTDEALRARKAAFLEGVADWDSLSSGKRRVLRRVCQRLCDVGLAGKAEQLVEVAAEVGNIEARIARGLEILEANWGRQMWLSKSLAANGLEAQEAFIDAAIKCNNMKLTAQQTRVLLENTQSLYALSHHIDTIENLSLTGTGSERVAAIRRVGAFLSGLDDVGTATPEILMKVIGTGVDDAAVLSRIASTPELVADTERLTQVLDDLAKFRSSGAFMKTLMRVGIAMESVAVVLDFDNARKTQDRINGTLQDMENMMMKSGFTKDGDLYTHPDGAEIEIALVRAEIGDDGTPLWTRAGLQSGVAVVGTGMLIADMMVLTEASLLAGPYGMALAGIAVSIHAGTEAWYQSENKANMRHLPMPVIAALSTARVVGAMESKVIAGASNWTISDVWEMWWRDNEDDKELIRKKAYLSILYREMQSLGRINARLYNLILNGKSPIAFIEESNEVFTEDFESFFLKFNAIDLFMETSDKLVFWKQFRTGKTDTGWLDWQNVTHIQHREAMRGALMLYAMNILEPKLRETWAKLMPIEKQIEQLISENKQREAAVLDSREAAPLRVEIEKLGLLFGSHIKDLPPRSDGKNYATGMLDEMVENLDRAERLSQGVGIEPAMKGTRTMMSRLSSNGLFTLKLPNGIAPHRTHRNIHFSSLPSIALENQFSYDLETMLASDDAAESTKAKMQYLMQLNIAKSLYLAIKGVGTAFNDDSTWLANYDHFTLVDDYFQTLEYVPSLDPNGTVRSAIKSLRRFAWEPGGITSGDLYGGERNQAFRNVVVALRSHVDYLEGQYYHFFEFDSSQPREYTEKASVGFDVLMLTTSVPAVHLQSSSGDSHTLRLASGNMTQTFSLGDSGTARCKWTGKEEYMWYITAAQPVSMRAYEVNRYGVEQPGRWMSIERPRNRVETIAAGQDYHIYPHKSFAIEITLTNGEKISGNNKGKNAKEAEVARLATQTRLKNYVKILPERVTDTQNLKMFGSKENKYYSWSTEQYGWRFTIPKSARSKVQSIRLSSSYAGLTTNEMRGESRTIDVVHSPFGEPIKRVRHTKLPEHLASAIRYTRLSEATGHLRYPHREFTISLVLADGRVIRGDQNRPGELHEYLEFKPEVLFSKNKEGGRYPVDELGKVKIPKDAYKWRIYFRNRNALRSMTLTYPDGNKLAMESESLLESLVRRHHLIPKEDGGYSISGWTGTFTPREDGTLLWSGGYTPQGLIFPALINRKGKWGKYLETPAGKPFEIVAGDIRVYVKRPDGKLKEYFGPKSDSNLSIQKKKNGTWEILPQEGISMVLVQDIQSGKFIESHILDTAVASEETYMMD